MRRVGHKANCIHKQAGRFVDRSGPWEEAWGEMETLFFLAVLILYVKSKLKGK